MGLNFSARMLVPALLAFFLMLVWPMAHTIALRNVLLAAGFIWALVMAGRRGLPLPHAPTPLLWLVALVVWMLAQAVFLAVDPGRALGEIRGQWVPALAAGFFGYLLAVHAAREHYTPSLWRGIVLLLAVHASATLLFAAAPLLEGGSLLRRVGGLTEGPDKSSYLTVTLACVLLAASVGGAANRLLPKPIIFLLLPLVLATLYVEQIRNALVSLAVAVLLLAAFLLTRPGRGRTTRLAVSGTLAAILLVFFALAVTDARRQGTLESARAAWQADTRSVVLEAKLDQAGSDPSAYLRFAMLKEGLAMAAAHPLGVGYHRNAFGHALRLEYGMGSGHSHSSLLDIAIGVGVPGVLLLVGFFVSCMKTGWHTERIRHDGLGLMLLLLAGSTLVRAVLDSCLRDHMLQQTFFLLGLLLAAAAKPPSEQDT